MNHSSRDPTVIGWQAGFGSCFVHNTASMFLHVYCPHPGNPKRKNKPNASFNPLVKIPAPEPSKDLKHPKQDIFRTF